MSAPSPAPVSEIRITQGHVDWFRKYGDYPHREAYEIETVLVALASGDSLLVRDDSLRILAERIRRGDFIYDEIVDEIEKLRRPTNNEGGR